MSEFKVGDKVEWDDEDDAMVTNAGEVVYLTASMNELCVKNEFGLHVLYDAKVRPVKPKPTALLVEWKKLRNNDASGAVYFDTEPGFVDPAEPDYHRFVVPLCTDGQPVEDLDVLYRAGYAVYRSSKNLWAFGFGGKHNGDYKTHSDAWRAASDHYRKSHGAKP